MGHSRNDDHETRLQALIQPTIGMESAVRNSVLQILNDTLANEAVLSQKTHNAHWSLSGAGFFELHTLFDVQYKQLKDIFDEITKRARIMGGLPIDSFEEFFKNARLDEQHGETPDIMGLLADHEASIRFLREDAKKCSEEYKDEGTSDLLESIMRQHEKMAWMLRSYIEPELTGDESKGSKT